MGFLERYSPNVYDNMLVSPIQFVCRNINGGGDSFIYLISEQFHLSFFQQFSSTFIRTFSYPVSQRIYLNRYVLPISHKGYIQPLHSYVFIYSFIQPCYPNTFTIPYTLCSVILLSCNYRITDCSTLELVGFCNTFISCYT